MSIIVFVLGESGSGKTASLRNMDPRRTLLLSAIRKHLSFRGKGWGLYDRDANPTGNIMHISDAATTVAILKKTKSKVIVLDDFQEVMTREFIMRAAETGYQKFTDIAVNVFDVLDAAADLDDDVRVYILAHTATDEYGFTRIKTVGRMVDEKIAPESRATICLRTVAQGGQYQFRTHTTGTDTAKTPIGMFEDDLIDNDLAAVDATICDYYGIDGKPVSILTPPLKTLNKETQP